jgi:hypothetical protein
VQTFTMSSENRIEVRDFSPSVSGRCSPNTTTSCTGSFVAFKVEAAEWDDPLALAETSVWAWV